MSHYHEQFLKQSPLAVMGVLRDLQRGQVAIKLAWPQGQLISKILAVTPERLTLDFGSQSHENHAVLQAGHIDVTAETAGAKVEFSLPGLIAIGYQNLPAFSAELPPSLWFVQRREFFRIAAPLQPRYFCRTSLADTTPFVFQLCDLSLGGLGALLEGELPETLKEGVNFSQVEMDLAQWGKFYFDMQLVTISERKVVDSKNQTITTPRLSFRFLNVNAAVERELQKIIFSLERTAREKANRVRES
ncbi:flagellar brake protein [Citrobacter sp. JGM124]|uniref:flagellar brake protein YcgR n=1 Tax=Citrobacter sp. JGM124 TaxID=2799789 RepID=UPI001BA5F683|nr:flagellar brake protein [Citrobacter sp. JGM124]MBS0847138.1 flagellar brake protein [Citrobacter sp. JGM124]